jgi:Outer membrane protein beta-barrel domain
LPRIWDCEKCPARAFSQLQSPKKIYTMRNIAIVAFLFVAHFSQAQFSIGVRGGIINASFNYSELAAGQSSSERLGLIGGLLAEFRINEGFAIQPEVNYVQRGDKKTSVFTLPFISNIETTNEVRINYLEIPVMLKGGFKVGPARLDLLAGPSLSLAMSGTDKTKIVTTNLITNTTSEDSYTNDLDFEQDIQKSDVNLQGGAMLSFALGGSRFFVDGRYIYGLTNLSKTDEVEITNRGISLTAGLFFGF